MAARIPELGQGAGQVHVRLPPTTSVPMTPRTMAIVDHPAFQRLRQVTQLGPTHMVYPGAVHTRFEHSLGVFFTAGQYLNHLLEVPAFAERVDEADLLTVLAAALLHDIGHYPMAHSLEALHLKGNDTPRHEDIAADIIRGDLPRWRGDRSLAEILSEHWGIDPERVIAFIARPRGSHGRDVDALLASIISSGIDADKMDYLGRDSLHMGVPYGRNYDRQRLLDSLTVAEDGRSIAVTAKGRTPAEIFIFCRYTMFSEAYWHHTVRSVSAMVEASMADLQRCGVLPDDRLQLVDDLLGRADAAMLDWLMSLAPADSDARRILGGMTGHRRALYKRVVTLSRLFDEPRTTAAYEHLMGLDSAGLRQVTEALRRAVREDLGIDIPEGGLVIDTPPRDKDHFEDVEVAFPALAGHRRRRLTDISAVVRAISGDFLKVVKKVRVFVAPEFAEGLRSRQDRLEEIFLGAILP